MRPEDALYSMRSISRPGTRVMGFVVSDLMVIALMLASVAGVVFDRPALTALGTLVLVLTLVCRVWARKALERVTYSCETSSLRAMEGDTVVLTLTLENHKSLPVAWLRVREHIPDGLELVGEEEAVEAHSTPASHGFLLMTTTALGPSERVRITFHLRAVRRGRYVFGPARLNSGDPFGFYESERVVARTASTLLVMPQMPMLPGVSMRLARPVGDRALRTVGCEDPVMPVTVREYVRGDALRGMDWKASARRGEPYVRVNDVSVTGSVMLLLECDTRITGIWDTSQEKVDQIVRVAAALARDLLAAGQQVGLVANGVPPGDLAHIVLAPGAGRGQLALILDTLARVQPVVVKPLSTLVEEHASRMMGFGTVAVCVAAVLQRDTRDLLAARRRDEMPATLVHVATESAEPLLGVRTIQLDPRLVGSAGGAT
jgi:uncharacterized protein (DUF58 family)